MKLFGANLSEIFVMRNIFEKYIFELKEIDKEKDKTLMDQ